MKTVGPVGSDSSYKKVKEKRPWETPGKKKHEVDGTDVKYGSAEDTFSRNTKGTAKSTVQSDGTTPKGHDRNGALSGQALKLRERINKMVEKLGPAPGTAAFEREVRNAENWLHQGVKVREAVETSANKKTYQTGLGVDSWDDLKGYKISKVKKGKGKTRKIKVSELKNSPTLETILHHEQRIKALKQSTPMDWNAKSGKFEVVSGLSAKEIKNRIDDLKGHRDKLINNTLKQNKKYHQNPKDLLDVKKAKKIKHKYKKEFTTAEGQEFRVIKKGKNSAHTKLAKTAEGKMAARSHKALLDMDHGKYRNHVSLETWEGVRQRRDYFANAALNKQSLKGEPPFSQGVKGKNLHLGKELNQEFGIKNSKRYTVGKKFDFVYGASNFDEIRGYMEKIKAGDMSKSDWKAWKKAVRYAHDEHQMMKNGHFFDPTGEKPYEVLSDKAKHQRSKIKVKDKTAGIGGELHASNKENKLEFGKDGKPKHKGKGKGDLISGQVTGREELFAASREDQVRVYRKDQQIAAIHERIEKLKGKSSTGKVSDLKGKQQKELRNLHAEEMDLRLKRDKTIKKALADSDSAWDNAKEARKDGYGVKKSHKSESHHTDSGKKAGKSGKGDKSGGSSKSGKSKKSGNNNFFASVTGHKKGWVAGINQGIQDADKAFTKNNKWAKSISDSLENLNKGLAKNAKDLVKQTPLLKPLEGVLDKLPGVVGVAIDGFFALGSLMNGDYKNFGGQIGSAVLGTIVFGAFAFSGGLLATGLGLAAGMLVGAVGDKIGRTTAGMLGATNKDERDAMAMQQQQMLMGGGFGTNPLADQNSFLQAGL